MTDLHETSDPERKASDLLWCTLSYALGGLTQPSPL
jgi:hypothetical protein